MSAATIFIITYRPQHHLQDQFAILLVPLFIQFLYLPSRAQIKRWSSTNMSSVFELQSQHLLFPVLEAVQQFGN